MAEQQPECKEQLPQMTEEEMRLFVQQQMNQTMAMMQQIEQVVDSTLAKVDQRVNELSAKVEQLQKNKANAE